jgi:hypothetical protein
MPRTAIAHVSIRRDLLDAGKSIPRQVKSLVAEAQRETCAIDILKIEADH